MTPSQSATQPCPEFDIAPSLPHEAVLLPFACHVAYIALHYIYTSTPYIQHLQAFSHFRSPVEKLPDHASCLACSFENVTSDLPNDSVNIIVMPSLPAIDSE